MFFHTFNFWMGEKLYFIQVWSFRKPHVQGSFICLKGLGHVAENQISRTQMGSTESFQTQAPHMTKYYSFCCAPAQRMKQNNDWPDVTCQFDRRLWARWQHKEHRRSAPIAYIWLAKVFGYQIHKRVMTIRKVSIVIHETPRGFFLTTKNKWRRFFGWLYHPGFENPFLKK